MSAGVSQINPEAFGREWERLEEILHVDWDVVFPDGVSEMSPSGFYVRLALGRQITGGTSVRARETRYNPALEYAVENGDLTVDYNEDGEPIVRHPNNTSATEANR